MRYLLAWGLGPWSRLLTMGWINLRRSRHTDKTNSKQSDFSTMCIPEALGVGECGESSFRVGVSRTLANRCSRICQTMHSGPANYNSDR